MSLINDALKRAKQAQQPPPLAAQPGPTLHPVEPARPAHWNLALLLVPAALVVIALIGLLLVWQVSRQQAVRGRSLAAQAAKSSLEAAPPPATDLNREQIAKAPGADVPAEPESLEPPRSAALQPVQPPSATASAAAPVKSAVQPPPTATSAARFDQASPAAPASQVRPAEPNVLRLQAVVYNPRRPSAMVNGQTLFIGDYLGNFQVVGIAPNRAVLVNGTVTNILTLNP